MAARQVCGLGCNSRRHIRCVIYLTVPPVQLEPLQSAPQTWKQTNTSILQNNYIFVPLACKVMGSWSNVSIEFLDSLSEKITMVTGDTNEKSHLYQRISIALQRGNAACVQCCFCNEDDPLEWPLTTIAIFSCATIFNACGSPWARKKKKNNNNNNNRYFERPFVKHHRAPVHCQLSLNRIIKSINPISLSTNKKSVFRIRLMK